MTHLHCIRISLSKMRANFKDYVFLDEQVELRVLSSGTHWSALHFSVDDRYNDTILLSIYNFSKTLARKLEVGRRIIVRQPYFRKGSRENFIRVDDPRQQLVIVEDGFPSCWVCHRTNSKDGKPLLQCGRCKRAKYCSETCQRYDWGEMQHKVECQKKY